MSADSTPHSELASIVREGLNPRGHHRLCRVNVPTDFSSECNCPYEENEREHAALDSLVEQLEAADQALRNALIALREIAYEDNPPGDTWIEGVEWAGKIARDALASSPASSPSKAAGGWCERHGGYLGQRCATCALEVADSAPASEPNDG